MIDIGEPDGDIEGMNDLGDIVGNANGRAFVWRNGNTTDLFVPDAFNNSQATDINDRGIAVGTACTSTETRAVVWIREQPIFIAGPAGIPCTEGVAINESGLVAILGTPDFSGKGRMAGFLWNVNDGLSELPLLQGYPWARLRDINKVGDAVGYVTGIQTNDPNSTAVIWKKGSTAPIELFNLILKNTGWRRFQYAHAINDSGVIIGNGRFENVEGPSAFMLRPI